MTHIAASSFLSSPGLWIGLAVAAAFLAGSGPAAPLSRTNLIPGPTQCGADTLVRRL